MATDPYAVFGRFDTTGSGGGVDHGRFGAVSPLLFPHDYPYPSPADGDDTYEDDEELASRLAPQYAVQPMVAGVSLVNQGNNPYWAATNASRNVLFVLFTNDRVVKAYSLADESMPVLLGTSPTLGSSPAALAVYGTNVYVTDQTDLTLKVIDASNAASMTVSSTLTYDSSGGTGGGRFAISSDGTRALIGGPETGANANKCVLVSLSGTPSVLGRASVSVGSTHRGVAYLATNTWALASRDDASVRIIDSSTSSPTQAASFVTSSGTITTPLKAYGSFLYVGNYGTGRLEKWNVVTPTSPFLVASVAIAAGSEQIDLTSDGAYAFVACRSTARMVMVRTSDMSVVQTYSHTGTTTPGVAVATNYVYATCAGDTTNGKIFVFGLPGSVASGFAMLDQRMSGIESTKANLAGANTFSGKQTLSAAVAVLIDNIAAEIDFYDIPMRRTAAGRCVSMLNFACSTSFSTRVVPPCSGRSPTGPTRSRGC